MIDVGSLEIFVALIVALVVFGPKRLPELARVVGRTLAWIRRSLDRFRKESKLDEYLAELRMHSNIGAQDLKESLQDIKAPIQEATEEISALSESMTPSKKRHKANFPVKKNG